MIDTLTAWWETDFHDDAARALAYAEAITVADDRRRRFRLRHGALAEHFSQEEILEIIGIGINMNVWTRLKLAEGATPGSPSRRCRERAHLPSRGTPRGPARRAAVRPAPALWQRRSIPVATVERASAEPR